MQPIEKLIAQTPEGEAWRSETDFRRAIKRTRGGSYVDHITRVHDSTFLTAYTGYIQTGRGLVKRYWNANGCVLSRGQKHKDDLMIAPTP